MTPPKVKPQNGKPRNSTDREMPHREMGRREMVYREMSDNPTALNMFVLPSQSIREMHVYFQNVRGLRTKVDELFLAVNECEYEIIVLVETNFDETVTSAQLFGENYVVYRNDRDTTNSNKKSGGGVLVAVHRKLLSSPVICIAEDLELVLARIRAADSSWFVCAGYIPPELRSNAPFVQYFANAISDSLDCASDGDSIIVCGDFNQANLVWQPTEQNHVIADPSSVGSASAYLLDNMASMNLKQYSRVMNPWSNTLDLVFANVDSCVVTEAAVSLVNIDRPHPPLDIALIMTDIEPLYDHEDCPQLDFKCIDFVSLHGFLEQVDWTCILACSDVDNAVHRFSQIVSSWLSSNVPKKRLPAKPPWGNGQLRSLKREKNACQRHYRRLRTPLHKRRFQAASDAYKSLNKYLYVRYVDKTQKSLRRHPKRFWNFINSKRKQNDGVPATVTLVGEVASTASDKCELFAKHFSSVFNVECATSDDAMRAASVVPEDLCDIGIPIVTEAELRHAAKKMKPSITPGPDGIPAIVFKKCIDALAIPLCYIFNLSLQKKKFPAQWKKSFMFPIYKNGNKSDVRNYRGITSLCAGSKLFETIINNYLFARTKTTISSMGSILAGQLRLIFFASPQPASTS
ncbi:uncharacterized protein LOC134290499 [Aedes albopictus]|uniref:Endonuclease/exonuclease/phosphatase domain-containing protein n=1 Tax=Aedes albopictus TaxID=7160 RepID=A0ABM1Y208_AEDAL